MHKGSTRFKLCFISRFYSSTVVYPHSIGCTCLKCTAQCASALCSVGSHKNKLLSESGWVPAKEACISSRCGAQSLESQFSGAEMGRSRTEAQSVLQNICPTRVRTWVQYLAAMSKRRVQQHAPVVSMTASLGDQPSWAGDPQVHWKTLSPKFK